MTTYENRVEHEYHWFRNDYYWMLFRYNFTVREILLREHSDKASNDSEEKKKGMEGEKLRFASVTAIDWNNVVKCLRFFFYLMSCLLIGQIRTSELPKCCHLLLLLSCETYSVHYRVYSRVHVGTAKLIDDESCMVQSTHVTSTWTNIMKIRLVAATYIPTRPAQRTVARGKKRPFSIHSYR